MFKQIWSYDLIEGFKNGMVSATSLRLQSCYKCTYKNYDPGVISIRNMFVSDEYHLPVCLKSNILAFLWFRIYCRSEQNKNPDFLTVTHFYFFWIARRNQLDERSCKYAPACLNGYYWGTKPWIERQMLLLRRSVSVFFKKRNLSLF